MADAREVMLRRLQGAGFHLRAQVPGGPASVWYGQQWPGRGIVVFPRMLGQAGEDGVVDLAYVVVERATGEAVGQLGTKGPVDEAGSVEIGYGLNESAWGRGVDTEAVGALVGELVSRPGVRAVTAQTTVENVASQPVLAKNGFVRTAHAWDEDDGDLLAQVWPLYGLVLRVGALELRLPDDSDLAELAQLAGRGVHHPQDRPFLTPWTDGSPADRERIVVEQHWQELGGWASDAWRLGQGVGTLARVALLALAFDHLGAHAAGELGAPVLTGAG